MSGDSWTDEAWPRGERREHESLPRIEDIPVVDRGYDQEAVERAFEAFYRHAAQLDASLRVLESVETFRRHATDLRSDIRALRAASWSPVPVHQQPWVDPYAIRGRAGGDGPQMPSALPRIAAEAAFIILVAVAAGLAELDNVLTIGAVLAAWLIVALIELAAATTRWSLRPTARTVPPRQVAPLEEPAAYAAPAVATPDAVVEPAPEATVIGAVPSSAGPPAVELEPAAEAEPAAEPPAVVETDAVAEPEPQAEFRAEPEAELEAEPSVVAEAEREEPVAVAEPNADAEAHEAEPEPVAVADPEVEPEAEADVVRLPPVDDIAGQAPVRRRFWRRRAQPPVELPPPEPDPPRHVRIVPRDAEAATDPWETPADAAPEAPAAEEIEPVVEAVAAPEPEPEQHVEASAEPEQPEAEELPVIAEADVAEATDAEALAEPADADRLADVEAEAREFEAEPVVEAAAPEPARRRRFWQRRSDAPLAAPTADESVVAVPEADEPPPPEVVELEEDVPVADAVAESEQPEIEDAAPPAPANGAAPRRRFWRRERVSEPVAAMPPVTDEPPAADEPPVGDEPRDVEPPVMGEPNDEARAVDEDTGEFPLPEAAAVVRLPEREPESDAASWPAVADAEVEPGAEQEQEPEPEPEPRTPRPYVTPRARRASRRRRR